MLVEEQTSRVPDVVQAPAAELLLSEEPVTAATDTEYSANETWPVMNKPRQIFRPEDIVWDHTLGPMGTPENVELFNLSEPSQPKEEAPTSRFAEAIRRFKASSVATLGRKIGNWVSNNRTEAIAYCVGAAAAIQTLHLAKEGVAGLHIFDTFSNLAHTFVDLKELAPQTTAETSAGNQLLAAGASGVISIGAIGAGLTTRRTSETKLPNDGPKIRAYTADRPTEYYFMTADQLRERAAQLNIQSYYLNVLRFLPKAKPSVYYADSFTVNRPTLGTVYYGKTFNPIVDPKTFYKSISWKQLAEPEILPMDMDFVPPTQKSPVVESPPESSCKDILEELDQTFTGISKDLQLIAA